MCPDEIKDGLHEAREPEDVTPEIADKVVSEIIDYDGRRPIPLADGRTLFVRTTNEIEEEQSAVVYSKELFRLKKEGVPFAGEIALMVLDSVGNDPEFGYRPLSVLNEELIDEITALNKESAEDYDRRCEELGKDNVPEPEYLKAPEPVVDEGSPSLKDIIEGTKFSPTEKVYAMISCLQNTVYSHLVMNSAEYLAGKAKSKFILSKVIESGVEFNGKWQFSPYYKDVREVENENPAYVAIFETVYQVFQQEVLKKDFLHGLLKSPEDGIGKKQ
jgi:hypothetical protein